MNFIKLFLIICVIVTSCKSKSSKESFKNFNFLALKKTTLVISCIKCDCILDQLNKIYPNGIDTNYVQIFADTNCTGILSKKILVNFISQGKIDSLSTEFHNMLIIKKRGDQFTHLVVKTSESEKLETLISDNAFR